MQDHQADLHHIFKDDSKWTSIDKLGLFLNSFGSGREVQTVTFALDPASQNAAWEENGLLLETIK